MFLRSSSRKKDGKEHRYFSIVENKRVAGRARGATPRVVSGRDQFVTRVSVA